MHGFWNCLGMWREEPCNAFCRGDIHAMVTWTNCSDDEIAEAMGESNPTFRIVAIEPAHEVPIPPGPYGDFVRKEGLWPRLMRFRSVEAEAA